MAATLATATQARNPTQLLVTTYENTIARQLAEGTPDASIVNVRASSNRLDPMETPDDDVNEHEGDADNHAETRRAS